MVILVCDQLVVIKSNWEIIISKKMVGKMELIIGNCTPIVSCISSIFQKKKWCCKTRNNSQ